MDGEELNVTIRGGVIDGTVYIRAEDVITSLRLTAKGYREVAAEVEEDESEAYEDLARLFDSEADDYDLIAMQLVNEDADDELHELDEESDG